MTNFPKNTWVGENEEAGDTPRSSSSSTRPTEDPHCSSPFQVASVVESDGDGDDSESSRYTSSRTIDQPCSVINKATSTTKMMSHRHFPIPIPRGTTYLGPLLLLLWI